MLFISGLLVDKLFFVSLNLRILATFLTLLPLGFFMGMPFPYGIKIIKEFGSEDGIPLIWGINGIMSVGGSVLAVILSMKLEFSFTIFMGAAIYLVLFITMPLYDATKY